MEEERLKLNLQLFADEDDEEEEEKDLDPNDFEDEDEEEDEESNDEEESEEEEEEEDSEEADKSKGKKEVTEEEKARRAKAAERRRRKEQAEREKEEAHKKEIEKAKTDAELGLLKVNPYTEEPIKDKFDLDIYKLQKEIDENGGDPINDLPARLAKKNREKEEEEAAKDKKAKEEKEKQEADIKKGIQDFQKKYPKVNVQKLADNVEFQKYAENKWGRWTLTEIYEGFKNTESEEDDVEAEEQAKKFTKVPKGSGPSTYTSDKVKKMTDAEFDKYWREKYGD